MIELVDICKSFGNLRALDRVSLQAEKATIHGLVGENGAGKSTLMKILAGFLPRTSGIIKKDNREVHIRTPKDASSLGIGMLFQEPLDFWQMTVLENFMAGGKSMNPQESRATLHGLCDEFSLNLAPDRYLRELTIGERHQLELLRLVNDKRDVLILDEPTSGISERQQQKLFTTLKALRQKGTTIFLITHKLTEVEQLCDRVTVLRHGKVSTTQQRPFHREQLLASMFDEIPHHQPRPRAAPEDRPVLQFSDVSSAAGRSGLHDCSLTVTRGEVVGIAGIDGSGQATFLQLGAGLLHPDQGSITWFGHMKTPARDPEGATTRPVAFIPADRSREGLFGPMSLREHHLLAHCRQDLIFPHTWRRETDDAIHRFNIRGQAESSSDELSGGNQQRLLLSLLPTKVRLVLLENPCRGLDLTSARWVWTYLHQQAARGCTVIFGSPDLDEILYQADRILVFFNGRIVLDTPRTTTSLAEISRAVTGTIVTGGTPEGRTSNNPAEGFRR